MAKKLLWSPDRPKRPDVDPMLATLRDRMIKDPRSAFAKANVSGLAPATIKRIEDGITKRPYGTTYVMMYRALGYELVPKKIRT